MFSLTYAETVEQAIEIVNTNTGFGNAAREPQALDKLASRRRRQHKPKRGTLARAASGADFASHQ